ncbi:MAG: hypothetical protein L0J23_01580, partial [Bifidobacterium crudilactis]|nr:hypothetical protein [Bifidobacterium crudilactis]
YDNEETRHTRFLALSDLVTIEKFTNTSNVSASETRPAPLSPSPGPRYPGLPESGQKLMKSPRSSCTNSDFTVGHELSKTLSTAEFRL